MQDIQFEEELEIEDNSKILQMLEEGVEVRKLKDNEGFKLIDKACKAISDNAKRRLLTIEAKTENMSAIIELQLIAKLYGDVLGNIRKSFIDTSELAFEEAKKRGLIQVPDSE